MAVLPAPISLRSTSRQDPSAADFGSAADHRLVVDTRNENLPIVPAEAKIATIDHKRP